MVNHTPVTPETPEIAVTVNLGSAVEVIASSRASTLTATQSKFVDAYIQSDGDPSFAAYTAGIVPGSGGISGKGAGLRMLRDLQVAREVYYRTQTVMLGDALKARQVLRGILDSTTASNKDKIAAAKTMLDRGGFPAAGTAKPAEVEDAAPSEMSADQLAGMVGALRRQLAAQDAEYTLVEDDHLMTPAAAPEVTVPENPAPAELNPAATTPVDESVPETSPDLDAQLRAALAQRPLYKGAVEPERTFDLNPAPAAPPTFAGGLPVYGS